MAMIELSPDEALVLFDFLSRFEKSDRFDQPDAAEQRVLWNLQAELERQLAEPFRAHYAELLAAARERVRDRA